MICIVLELLPEYPGLGKRKLWILEGKMEMRGLLIPNPRRTLEEEQTR